MQYASLRLAGLVVAAFVAWSSGGHAAVVTYEFTGTAGPQGFHDGETLKGTFSFDTATPGTTFFPNAGSFHYQIGSHLNITAPIASITRINGEAALSDPDTLVLGSTAPAVTTPFFEGSALFLEFIDPTGTAFSTDLLSEPLPPASAFASRQFFGREFIASIQIDGYSGTIDSLRLLTDGDTIAVAEPPGAWLAMFAAFLALAACQRLDQHS